MSRGMSEGMGRKDLFCFVTHMELITYILQNKLANNNEDYTYNTRQSVFFLSSLPTFSVFLVLNVI